MTNLQECQMDENKVDILLFEANALATYLARQGNVLAADTSNTHLDFLTALSKLECENSAANWIELQNCYAKVTAITYADNAVNGHTIVETHDATSGWRNAQTITRFRPAFIGFSLFIMAILLEIFKSWVLALQADPIGLSEFEQFVSGHGKIAIVFLVGAVWGGIGSCIFLMKRISDKLFAQAYDSAKVRGDVTRIFLGSMLGVCVLLLFFPELSESSTDLGDVKIGPAATAFVAGLGVKPVYAAFETLSEELAVRLGKTRPAKKEV